MKCVVLVAISDPFRMELVQEACESAGYDVLLASGTESALTIMARQPASVVITDDSCDDLVSILKNDRELSATPIVTTGGDGTHATAVLRQPLRVDDVQRVLRKILREPVLPARSSEGPAEHRPPGAVGEAPR